MSQELAKRPFDFSEVILKHLREMVKPGDLLIHLGDFCFGQEVMWHERYMANLPGVHHWFCMGNHDKRGVSWYLDHGWAVAVESLTLTMFGKQILFSHVPKAYSGYGLNIHGHFHDNHHRSHEPEFVAIKHERQVLLAIELTHYCPVKVKTLVEKWDRENQS